MKYLQLQGTRAAFGPLRFCAYRADGQPMMSSAFVREPVAIEFDAIDADTWSLDRDSVNDAHFFGPTVAA